MVDAQTRTQLVGRERELGELRDALETSRSGSGRTVLIGGEPGIGKSRLADELASIATAEGQLVLWGRAWEDAGAPAYWPWVQALRILLRSSTPDQVRSYLGLGAPDVAQMLPELRAMFPDLAPPSGAESESARFQLFDSTTNLVRNAAHARPMLIVLDDLHAADTPTILLLRFLASQLIDIAALVVGTYRDLELTPDHPLTLAIAEMARERSTRLVMLGGLGSGAVSEYISATAKFQPDELTVAAVWRETNGNPLFVGEAVRLLEAEGRLREVADLTSLRVAVPAGVRAVIARRIGHLSERAGNALTVGAVIGPEFGIDVLRRMSELPPAETVDAVDEAVRAGLLQPVSGGSGRYRFSHDLVREALYDELPPGRRSRLHRRIAETLEVVYAGAGDAHLAELAFHFVQATQMADVDSSADSPADTRNKAIDYARRAGEQSSRALAYEEASQQFSMALAAMDAGEDVEPQARADILLELGDADARTGDLDKARTSFLDAARLARELGSGTVLARAAIGFGGRHQWARAGSDTILIPLLRGALELLGDDDDRLRVRLLTRLAGALRSDPTRRTDCARLSQEAVDLARHIADPASLSYALAGHFWATWWPENPEERDQLAHEIMAIADSVGDGERIAEAHLMRLLSLFELGRINEGRRQLDRLAEVVRQTRQPAHLWLEQVNRAELALFEGDFTLAERLIAEEMRGGYRVTPGRDDLSAARMHRLLLRREQGRVAEEEANVRASAHEFFWYPMHKAALCCLLLQIGRADEARAVFADIATDDFKAIYRDNEWLLGMSLASQACALLGDSSAAAVLYEQLAPYAGRHAIGHAEGSVGVVDAYLGLLAATLGRLDDAERHLVAAIVLLEEQGGRPWKAHAQHDLANVLRRREHDDDAKRAAELDAEALRTATEIGMVLANEIRAAGEPAPTGTFDAASPRADWREGGMFRREGDSWAIEFGTETFRVRDSKGMHHLARLLGSQGREIHALDLVRADAPADAGVDTVARGTHSDLVLGDASAVGPALDGVAVAAYRTRLVDIREELDEAERWNDAERAALLENEQSALIAELSSAFGLGGRERDGHSSAERARVSVTRAIRVAMSRINEYSPALGAHLQATVRTGTYCSYVPDPRAPMEWRT